jgi:hypothetical protein
MSSDPIPPKVVINTFVDFANQLKTGTAKISAKRENAKGPEMTADKFITIDGITKVTTENIDSVDEEKCYYYQIKEEYKTYAYLITSDDKMNVKDKINYYLTKTSIPVLQVAKPAPAGDATPDAPAAPTGDADPAATGGRKSRRSRNQRKSRRSRKQRKSRRSRR